MDTTPAREPDRPDYDGARAIALALLETWEDGGDSIRAGRRNRALTAEQFTLIHSLAAHVHYLGRPAIDLFDTGKGLAALPLVRAMYECSLAAQWVAQVEDSAAAFVNEDVRQRRNLTTTLADARSEALRGAVVYGADLDDQPHGAGEAARRFHELCESLEPGGADAYAHYRMMSMQTHASVMLADKYLDPRPGDAELPQLRRIPNDTAEPYIGFVAFSLVWAGRAVDYCDMDNRRRSQLRAAARALGISSELHLTGAAQLAMQKRKRGAETKRPV